ncbi:MAG: tyrosine-type recombinase/integrase [Rhodospirillaceae bacterium]|nr:tyrosine-type recombinase/integrase [Rhodospirillaceae bacterium]MBT5561062.1 tyrosine-type recombinase/integrase [Rhodospirillaceae bacterium]MBT6242780.1 tyrosine-type recombinase/integrase [Rhodospirillaceae bacterium]
MPKPTGLLKRGNRYYARKKVPVDLAPSMGAQEIKRSLKTSDYREACRQLPLALAKIEATFTEARRKLLSHPATHLSDPEIHQLALLWFHGYEQQSRDKGLRLNFDPSEIDDIIHILEIDEYDLRQSTNPNTLAWVQKNANEFLQYQNVSLDSTGREYELFCSYINRAMIESVRRSKDRCLGESGIESYDQAFAAVNADAPKPELPQRLEITLGELVIRYGNDPARDGVTQKTKDGYVIIFRALVELLGADKPVREITREDCRNVRDILTTLPPNAGKRFPALTLKEAANQADVLGLPSIKVTTANSYLNNLSALFKFAHDEEYAESNPAINLSAGRPKDREKDRRLPFSIEQLNLIFQAPIYTGCKNDQANYAQPGPHVIRRGRFWVPLLSLFHGLRLNEACQLLVDDVEVIDDVPVLHIREDEETGNRLKSKAGERIIPVHPECLKMGFINFVKGQREAEEKRLFSELTKGRKGYYSDPFQKWFRRFLDKTGALAPKTSFHSFRHNFCDAMREADIPEERQDALGGWESSGSTRKVYGSKFTPATLHSEISKVKYRGLSLSRLYLNKS